MCTHQRALIREGSSLSSFTEGEERCAGDETRMRLSVKANRVVQTKVFGVWRIPVTKHIRAGNLESFELAVLALNRHALDRREALEIYPEERHGHANQQPLLQLQITRVHEA